MAVRATMVDLIAQVRLLIGDPAGASQQFTDQQIQDTLDRDRQAAYGLPLDATPEPGTGRYLRYTAPMGDWEADAALADVAGAALTPDSGNVLTGEWVFAESTLPPVYLTGQTYDCYSAAAMLLRMWAALVAREFDFQSDKQGWRRSQKREGLLALAAEYAGLTRPWSGELVRGDSGAYRPSTGILAAFHAIR